MLYGILVFIFTIIALMLVGIILIQSSKTGGMGQAMGGSAINATFGGQGADKLLLKVTGTLAVLFVGLALLINFIGVPGTEVQSNDSIIGQKAQNEVVDIAAPVDLVPAEETSETEK